MSDQLITFQDCLNEAKELNEAKSKLVTTWVEGNGKPGYYGIIIGTAGENTVELRIELSYKLNWKFTGDIKNAEGHRVDQVRLDEMKSYKTFQNKWKKENGKVMGIPDEALLRKVMNSVHDSNAKNFFYVQPND